MDIIWYTALCMSLIAFASARSKGSMDQHALRLNDEAEQEMDALVEETRQLNEKEIEDTAPEFGDLESKFNSLRPFKNKAQHRQATVDCPPVSTCGLMEWGCHWEIAKCRANANAHANAIANAIAQEIGAKAQEIGAKATAKAQEIGGAIKNASDEAKKVGGKIKDALVVF